MLDGPSDVDAEQALLGAILVNNQALPLTSGIVRPEHFAIPLHGEIYERMADAIGAGRPATVVTLLRSLPDEVAGIDMSMSAYLAGIAREATTVVNAPDYAATVRDAWALREVRALAQGAADQAAKLSSDPRLIIGQYLSELDSVRAEIDDRRVSRRHAGDCAEDTLDRLDRIRAGTEFGICATTGLVDLDHAIGGLKGGDLIVAAGRPGMGKSVLGSSISRQSALAGYGMSFFSLEMHDQQITARLLADQMFASRAPLAFKDILDGRLSDEQYERTIRAAAELKAMPLILDLSSSLTVSEIVARSRTLADQLAKQGKPLRGIVVDYLKFVRASDRYKGQRVYEVGEITSGLKQLAKDLDINVLLLAQLNRQVESREDKRPQLSDLRESGDVEADADVVLLLFREAYYLAGKDDPESTAKLLACENKLEIIIAKNRNGPTRTVEVFCDVASNAVRNLSRF